MQVGCGVQRVGNGDECLFGGRRRRDARPFVAMLLPDLVRCTRGWHDAGGVVVTGGCGCWRRNHVIVAVVVIHGGGVVVVANSCTALYKCFNYSTLGGFWFGTGQAWASQGTSPMCRDGYWEGTVLAVP